MTIDFRAGESEGAAEDAAVALGGDPRENREGVQGAHGGHCFAQVRFTILSRMHEVVFQMSIPIRIRQLIIYISDSQQ